MLVLEFGQVVHVLVDNDVKVIGLIMRCDIACAERFRHPGRKLEEGESMMQYIAIRIYIYTSMRERLRILGMQREVERSCRVEESRRI